QDRVGEGREELVACRGEHVERVHDAVTREVVDEDLLQGRVVVPVVERAGAGEEVDVGVAVGVVHRRADGAVEGGRPGAGVAADRGLERGRGRGRDGDRHRGGCLAWRY